MADGEAIIGVGADVSQLLAAMEEVGQAAQENVVGIAAAAAGEANVDTAGITAEVMAQIEAVETLLRGAQASMSITDVSGPDRTIASAGLTAAATQPIQQAIAGLPAETQPALFAALQTLTSSISEAAAEQEEINATAVAAAQGQRAADGELVSAKLKNVQAEGEQLAFSAQKKAIQQGAASVLERQLAQYGRLSEALGYEIDYHITIGELDARLEELTAEAVAKRREANATAQVGANVLAGGELSPIETEAAAVSGQRAAQQALVKRYQTLADAVGEEADLSLTGAEMETETNRLRGLVAARLADQRATQSAARPVELTQTEVDAQAVTAMRAAQQATVRNYTVLSERVGEQANLELSSAEMQAEIVRIQEQIRAEKVEEAAAAKLAAARATIAGTAPVADPQINIAAAMRAEQAALERRLATLTGRLADAGGNPAVESLPEPTNTAEYRERIAKVTAALGELSTAAQQQADMLRITSGEAARQATLSVEQSTLETESLTQSREYIVAKARATIAQKELADKIKTEVEAQGGGGAGGGNQGFLGSTFGGQFGSLARGIVSGGVAFAIFGGVREAVDSTLKLEESMARLRVRMTEIGQANQFPKLREDILAISRDTGIAADKVTEVAGKLSASFGSGEAGAAATRSVAQLAVVGGVDINTLQDQIQAIGRSYGKTGEQIVQVNDDITAASQRYGQSIDELAKGTAVLAQSGDFAGISVTKLTNIIGQAAQVSGTSASAIAERLTRIIPLIDTHASQLLVLARTDSTLGKVLTPETFQQGSGAVLDVIASNFKTFSQGVQEQLLQILGSGRGAQSLLPIFQQWSDIMKNVDNSTGNAGATQRAFNAQMQTAAETLKRIRTDFNLFIASLADSGALTGLEKLLSGFEKLVSLLGSWNDDLDHVPGKIAEIAVALKLVQVLVEKIAGTSLAGALLPAGARTFLGAAPAAAAAPVEEGAAAAVIAPAALTLSDLLLPAIAALAGAAVLDAANRYSDKNATGGTAGKVASRVGLDVATLGQAEAVRGARAVYNHFFGDSGSSNQQPDSGPPDDQHLKDLQKQADDLKKRIDKEQATLNDHSVPQVAIDAITKNMEDEKKKLEDLNTAIQIQKSNLADAAAAANAANVVSADASQGQLESLQALDDVKADYEAGVVPLQTLLDRIGVEAQAEGDLANGTTGADKLSHLRKAAQLRQQANQLVSQAASSGLDLQNSLDESTAGSDADAAQRAFDRTVALFNETTDPTAKAELAKKVVSAGNALLKATADQATSTADAAKILKDGIKLPPGLNSSLYGEELKQSDPEFVGSIFKAAASPDIADKALKLFTDLTTQGDSYIDAIKKVRDYLAEQWTIAHDHLYHNTTDADSGAPPPPTGNLFSRIAGAATPPAPAPPDPTPPPPAFDPPKPKVHIPTSQDVRDISASKKKQDQADQEAVTNERNMRAAQQQLRQAQAGGDAVALAQAGIDAANQALADAQADEKRAQKAGDANGVAKAQADKIKAQADKIRADKSMNDAMHQLTDSRINLLETLAKVAGDDVGAARYELQRAQGNLDDLLKNDPGNEKAINDAKGQVAQATQGVTDAILNTAVSEEQFLYDTGQVTTAQMIAFLQSQLKLPGLTKKQTEDLQKQIYQLQHTLGQDFQFDVPSDLKLPTLYEARRLEQTSAAGSGYQDNRQVNVQMYITNGMDQAQAKQFLADTVGTGNSVLSSNRRI